ncbi:hypothetical protein, partial [Enterococcus faecalis]|uniref:hypothetical protein n=1 Tax=Enterococcus faecalis TaxID=1351 RepID=UPI003CC65363
CERALAAQEMLGFVGIGRVESSNLSFATKYMLIRTHVKVVFAYLQHLGRELLVIKSGYSIF